MHISEGAFQLYCGYIHRPKIIYLLDRSTPLTFFVLIYCTSAVDSVVNPRYFSGFNPDDHPFGHKLCHLISDLIANLTYDIGSNKEDGRIIG